MEATTEATKKVTKDEFVNPFKEGVSYNEFCKAMGTITVRDYCKGKLTDEQIDFLETELNLLK